MAIGIVRPHGPEHWSRQWRRIPFQAAEGIREISCEHTYACQTATLRTINSVCLTVQVVASHDLVDSYSLLPITIPWYHPNRK